VTRVPGAAQVVEGIVLVRGAVVTVINLARLFGEDECQVSRAVVVEMGREWVALAVKHIDRVEGPHSSRMREDVPTLDLAALVARLS
jgi:chemotaxis signal transduction protein